MTTHEELAATIAKLCDELTRDCMINRIARIEHLIAAHCAEREQQWLPIESAPKDGTKILVWTHRGDWELATWDDDRYASKPRPFWWTSGHCGRLDMRQFPPLFWMPLPTK